LITYGFVTQRPAAGGETKAGARHGSASAYLPGLAPQPSWTHGEGSSLPTAGVEPITETLLEALQRLVNETGATVSSSEIPAAVRRRRAKSSPRRWLTPGAARRGAAGVRVLVEDRLGRVLRDVDAAHLVRRVGPLRWKIVLEKQAMLPAGTTTGLRGS